MRTTFHLLLAWLLSSVDINSTIALGDSLVYPNWAVLDGGDPVTVQGIDLDVSGNLAIVGSRGYPGVAFIFDLTTGDLVHRLEVSQANVNDLYGDCVAIDGDLAIVGSIQDNAAYIFDVTTGQLLHKLSPGNTGDFVRSVDISDGIAVLGVPTNKSDPNSTRMYGAAFLYDARSGEQISRINGPNGLFKESFGSLVAIEGGTAVIESGSPVRTEDIHVLDARTGELLWRYGWSTTREHINFRDIVIDGDLVVAGVSDQGSYYGMSLAYVFNRITGELLRKIDINVIDDNSLKSYHLDLSGGQLVVGTYGSPSNTYADVVNVFDVTTGEFLGAIPSPDPIGGEFGYTVALENRRLIVSDPASGNYRGITYSYILVPEPTSLALLCLGSLCLLRR